MREELEREIYKHPDNLENYAIYSDWLEEHGDPRGEFIKLQLQLESDGLDPFERLELQARERQLLDQNVYDWLGSLASLLLVQAADGTASARPDYAFSFARGWLATLGLQRVLSSDIARIKTAPEAVFLRRVTVDTDGDRACETLRYNHSDFVARLDELDLSYCGLTNEGARHLLAIKELKDLKLLDLTGNRIMPNMCMSLEEARLPVVLEDQQVSDDDFYDPIQE